MNANLRGLTVAIATALSVISACAGDVEGSDYDQSCATDDDCVLVSELDVEQNGCSRRCSSSCADVAINVRDKARHDDDVASAKDGCDSFRGPFCESAGIAACVRGACSVVPDGDAGAR